MATRVGFKIVNADMKSSHGDVVWTVGATQRLDADGGGPVMCKRGFHYCPRAADCLSFVFWEQGSRVLRVSVPDDADVIADDDQTKCCASALFVVADVTDEGGLLMLRRQLPWSFGGMEFQGIDVDSRFCVVVRKSNGTSIKSWDGRNAMVNAMVIWQDHVSPDAPIHSVIKGVLQLSPVRAGTARWLEYKALLDRVEPFERPLETRQ
jgi:hypothetical protein